MMRLFRALIVILFVVAGLLFAKYWYTTEILSDKTLPVIKIEDSQISIKCNSDEKDLLRGVSAYDKKDGDITAKVIVESVSKFSDAKKGTCRVTYAVCDSDNHVTSATRTVVYEDYVSPRFTMNRSLCYSQFETVNVSAVIGATDIFDEDISNNIIITSSDYEYGTEGNYKVTAKVTNSKGDIIEVQLPLIVENRALNAPVIELTDYLIYTEPGERVNFRKYFKSALDSRNLDVSSSLIIDSKEFDKDTPGVYTVHYFAEDDINRTGHTTLTIIVG